MKLLLFIFLYIYNPQDWFNIPQMGYVKSISASPFSVYITTSDGIFVFDKSKRKFDRTITQVDGLPIDIELGGYDMETSSLWVVSDKELVNYNPLTRHLYRTPLPLKGVTSLGIGKGFVYLTNGQEIVRIDKLNYTVESAGSVSGVEWYGKLSPYNPKDFLFLMPYYYLDDYLNRYEITSLYKDQSTLWVGTDGYGVFAYDLTTKISQHYFFGPGEREVLRIFPAKDGLWFLHPSGLSYYNPVKDSWAYFNTSRYRIFKPKNILISPQVLRLLRREGVYTAAQDKSGLFIGTGYGVYLFDSNSNTLIKELETKGEVEKIFIERDTIFVATTYGLLIKDRKDDRWVEVRDSTNKFGKGVYDITEIKGNRFFGCLGGVVVWDTLNKWKWMTLPGGDLSKPVYSLESFKDYLFCGLEKGLWVFNERTSHYQRFTSKEGLLSDKVNDMYAGPKSLWIATDRGISRVLYTTFH